MSETLDCTLADRLIPPCVTCYFGHKWSVSLHNTHVHGRLDHSCCKRRKLYFIFEEEKYEYFNVLYFWFERTEQLWWTHVLTAHFHGRLSNYTPVQVLSSPP